MWLKHDCDICVKIAIAVAKSPLWRCCIKRVPLQLWPTSHSSLIFDLSLSHYRQLTSHLYPTDLIQWQRREINCFDNRYGLLLWNTCAICNQGLCLPELSVLLTTYVYQMYTNFKGFFFVIETPYDVQRTLKFHGIH